MFICPLYQHQSFTFTCVFKSAVSRLRTHTLQTNSGKISKCVLHDIFWTLINTDRCFSPINIYFMRINFSSRHMVRLPNGRSTHRLRDWGVPSIDTERYSVAAGFLTIVYCVATSIPSHYRPKRNLRSLLKAVLNPCGWIEWIGIVLQSAVFEATEPIFRRRCTAAVY